jgi:hypothetical protein
MNKDEQLFESFKQFKDLYRSKIELTGQKIRQIEPFSIPFKPTESITYKEMDEVSIKMPYSDYERFMQNWNEYLNLMYVAKYNKMVGEEYHKLLMLISLLR